MHQEKDVHSGYLLLPPQGMIVLRVSIFHVINYSFTIIDVYLLITEIMASEILYFIQTEQIWSRQTRNI